ncbi:MAG: efflux RND transporter periplasmic adaptor subunit [Rhizobacter sp.]|nr:efflux RND transporter periplasmic adaptor subunit [Burkholderiaceae bacterium]MCO5123449.1 efflux RND transporter periplasmic adaptor subunit [Rhizobacter sp.]
MRKLWLLGGAAVVIAGGAAFVMLSGATSPFGGDKKDGKPPPATLEFTTREVVRPQNVSLPTRIEFSGPLVAPRTAVVRAKASGTLLDLKVNEGSRVRAGQVLGAIDLAELQSRVTDRSAAVEAAQAALDEAQRQHTAAVGLAAQKFISPTALQTSQSKLDAAISQLKSAQAQLATARIGIREASLVAPISGVVAKRNVVPGEKLSLEQPILTIVDLSLLELAGAVGTHEVSLLRPGMPVEVRVEGVAKPVAGELARIAPAAEPGTRAIGVTVSIENPKEVFRAGQYALGSVVLQDSELHLTVPTLAIVNVSGQDHVWLIDNGALVRRAITTGRRDDAQGRVEVLAGLTASAQVLAAGYDNLREGAKAVVVERAAPTASAAASNAVR